MKKAYSYSQRRGLISMFLCASFLAYFGYEGGDYYLLCIGLGLIVVLLTGSQLFENPVPLILDDETITVPKTGFFSEEKRILWSDIKDYKIRSRSLLFQYLRDGKSVVINLENLKGEDRNKFLKEFSERQGEDSSKLSLGFRARSSRVIVIGFIVIVLFLLLWE